jgi:hypothetical protein
MVLRRNSPRGGADMIWTISVSVRKSNEALGRGLFGQLS